MAAGIYLLIAGIFRIVGIFLDSSYWGWKLAAGILCLIAGLAILSNPLWSTTLASTWLVIFVGFLAMLQGAAGLIVAFQGGGWGMGALSVLGILFGLFLVINPLIGVATLTLILAISCSSGAWERCFRRSGCVGNGGSAAASAGALGQATSENSVKRKIPRKTLLRAGANAWALPSKGTYPLWRKKPTITLPTRRHAYSGSPRHAYPDATCGRTSGRARTCAPGGGAGSRARPGRRRERRQGRLKPSRGRCGRDCRAAPLRRTRPPCHGTLPGSPRQRTAAGGGAIRSSQRLSEGLGALREKTGEIIEELSTWRGAWRPRRSNIPPRLRPRAERKSELKSGRQRSMRRGRGGRRSSLVLGR